MSRFNVHLAIRPILLVPVLAVWLVASAVGQAVAGSPEPLLDNEFVRVSRLASSITALTVDAKSDTVLVRIADGTAKFVPKGTIVRDANPANVDLIIDLKKHWDAEVLPCSYPKQCTRETQMSGETIAWSTTLFTNGFITATTHRLAPHATLDSSYYTAKGTDRILVIPFTSMHANFGGVEESLAAGQPFFTMGTEVEVTAREAETSWLVLRINLPKQ
jgi:hypothetical protein